MKRDFLKELELSDEQIQAVMKEHGKAVNEYKDKADKVDTLESQIADYQNQIKDRDNQLEKLSNQAKGNEELEKQIKQLQEDNKQTADEYQKKLDAQAFDFKLSEALSKAQAKNPKAVKALLNTEAIKLDGENLLGLEDQLKSLQESDGYLFGGDEPTLKGRQPQTPQSNPTGYQGKNPFKKDSFNLTEQARLLREEPDLAKQLKAQA